MSHVALWPSPVLHIQTYLQDGSSLDSLGSVSHLQMSQVSHMNESSVTHEWVKCHTWMSQVSHMNESYRAVTEPCPTYADIALGWVKSHTAERFRSMVLPVTSVLRVYSCMYVCMCVFILMCIRMYIYVYIHTYTHNSSISMVQEGWASLKEWMRHVARMNESCRTCDRERHDLFMCATWLIHVCYMTHSRVRHDSFLCAAWLIHVCDMTHLCVRRNQGRKLWRGYDQ